MNPSTSRLSRIGYAVAIVGILLVIAPPLSEAYVIGKLAALATGLFLAWAGLWRAPLRRTALDLPLAAFWAAMLLSAAFSIDPPVSVLGHYTQQFYGLLPLGLCTALYYAVAMNPDEALAERLSTLLLGASIPLSLFGIAQKFLGDPFISGSIPSGRITSTIGNPVMLGACLVVLLPIAVHRALAEKSELGRAAAGFMTFALVLTWARGAWACAALAVATYLCLSGRVRIRKRGWLALAAVTAVVLLVMKFALHKGDSDVQRVETFKSAISAIGSHPLLGYGPDTFLMVFRQHKTDAFIRIAQISKVIQFSAHNDLLQVAVTLGFLGLSTYLWLLGALAVRLRRRVSDAPGDGRVAMIAGALLGLFVQAKVSPVPPSGLALLAVLAGLVCAEPYRPPLKRSWRGAVCVLGAAFSAACAVLFARLCVADRDFLLGHRAVTVNEIGGPPFMSGVALLRRATELNPWNREYLIERCDVLFRVSAVAVPEQGRQLIEKAVQLARDGVRRHPGDASVHELYATALALSASRFGSDRMPEALAEIKTASALDPTATFTLRRRMEIAHALGDQAEFDRTVAEYKRVIQLTKEEQNWAPLLK